MWPTSCWAAPPPRSGPHPRLRLHQPRAGPGGTHRRRGQGPGIPRAAGKCVLGGNARTLIEGESGALSSWYFTGRAAPCWGLSCAVTGPPIPISELALAVTLELTAEQLLRPVRPHPTFAEAISEAVEAAFPLS